MRRTEQTEKNYQDYLATNPEPFAVMNILMDFDDWLVIDNEFPYDALLKIHHLLIPRKQVAKFTDLPKISQRKYHVILSKLEQYYDGYMVNMPKERSVPTHWHCHIFVWR